jgi:hypothetical protein
VIAPVVYSPGGASGGREGGRSRRRGGPLRDRRGALVLGRPRPPRHSSGARVQRGRAMLQCGVREHSAHVALATRGQTHLRDGHSVRDRLEGRGEQRERAGRGRAREDLLQGLDRGRRAACALSAGAHTRRGVFARERKVERPSRLRHGRRGRGRRLHIVAGAGFREIHG